MPSANAVVDFSGAGSPCILIIVDRINQKAEVLFSNDYSPQYIFLNKNHSYDITIVYTQPFTDSDSHFMWTKDTNTTYSATQFNLGGDVLSVTVFNMPFQNQFYFGSSGR